MKQEINPAIVVVVVVVLVAVIGGFLWKTNGDKQAYPGQDAKQPGASASQEVSGRPTAEQAKKMGFTGAQGGGATDPPK